MINTTSKIRLMKLSPIILITMVTLALWLPGNRANAADGTPIWTNYYNGTGQAQDGVTAMALDNNGNVYVTGYSDGAGTGRDFATIKYSGSGTALWTNRFNGPGNDYDYPNALAVDAGGNVYVGGTSYNSAGGSYNYATIKYSTAGMPVWTNYYSSPGDKQDQVTAIAVDSSGNVFVSGVSGYSGAGSYDFATIKYSSAGVASWTNRFGVANPTFERISLGLDAGGNVYISGSTADQSTGGFDYATLKYSSSGVALWTNIYPAGGYYNDRAKTLAVDTGGNVFVTGSSVGTAGDQDYATVKYSTEGIPLWTNRFNGAGNGADRLPVITTDAGGNAIVTGSSTGIGNDLEYATLKYSPTGTTLWTNRYNGAASSVDLGDDVCTDDSGNVYVTGFSGPVGSWDNATVKYSPTGTALWTNVFHARAIDPDSFPVLVTVDHLGNVFVAGSVYDNNGQANFFTVKYSGPPPPLRFATSNGSLGYTNGQFALTLTGPPGSNVVVSASSDLQTWNPLITNQLSGGTLRFTDATATNFSRRYYRARLQ